MKKPLELNDVREEDESDDGGDDLSGGIAWAHDGQEVQKLCFGRSNTLLGIQIVWHRVKLSEMISDVCKTKQITEITKMQVYLTVAWLKLINNFFVLKVLNSSKIIFHLDDNSDDNEALEFGSDGYGDDDASDADDDVIILWNYSFLTSVSKTILSMGS